MPPPPVSPIYLLNACETGDQIESSLESIIPFKVLPIHPDPNHPDP